MIKKSEGGKVNEEQFNEIKRDVSSLNEKMHNLSGEMHDLKKDVASLEKTTNLQFNSLEKAIKDTRWFIGGLALLITAFGIFKSCGYQITRKDELTARNSYQEEKVIPEGEAFGLYKKSFKLVDDNLKLNVLYNGMDK